MNILSSLNRLESKKAANWFRDNTATKIFVALGFLLVILSIIFAELKISSIYLMYANDYAPFGPAMAIYSLKVAIFVLFVFAIISSTAISNSILYQNPNLAHLFTLPIKSYSVFISKIVPGWISSTLILWLSLPLFLTYNHFIFKSTTFLPIALLGLLALSVISQALGTIIATLIAYFFGKITRQKQFIILLSLLTFFVILLKLLFPSALFHLADADDYSSFQHQLNNFPLMGKLLPTNWLVDSLAGTFDLISIFSTLVGILCLLIIIKVIGQNYYLVSWRRAQDQSFLAGTTSTKKRYNSSFPRSLNSKNIYSPLILNDFLSFIRSNSELNYLLFLGGLLAVLIFSVHNLVTFKDTTAGLLLAIYLISYVSLSMIFLTAAIRLIFPLMAKEKNTAWFSFSLPLSRFKYFHEKILFSVLLALPGIPLAALIVRGLKLSSSSSLVMIILMSATIIFINVLQCILGSINPNFRESKNPDAVSTSSLGIAGLGLSLLFIVISTMALNSYFHYSISASVLFLMWSFILLLILLPSYFLALKSLKKYSL